MFFPSEVTRIVLSRCHEMYSIGIAWLLSAWIRRPFLEFNHEHTPPVAKKACAQVLWAEGEGWEAIKGVYTRSASLNGDAVVVFVRALCAVSQVRSDTCSCEVCRAHRHRVR